MPNYTYSEPAMEWTKSIEARVNELDRKSIIDFNTNEKHYYELNQKITEFKYKSYLIYTIILIISIMNLNIGTTTLLIRILELIGINI